MSGIFPNGAPGPVPPDDGGIPPNPDDRNNPAQAYPPIIDPHDTDALYYSNECMTRIRPHVLNSLISEIAAIADRAEMGYRAANLTNLETSVRYIVQRGLPRGETMVQQNPWHFDITLDPPATRYNDYMTLSLVPRMVDGIQYITPNVGYVRLNVNGLGYVPLLRSDGDELHEGDIKHEVPFIAVCFRCVWYILGMRGPPGPQGPQGERGPQGEVGPAGGEEMNSIGTYISIYTGHGGTSLPDPQTFWGMPGWGGYPPGWPGQSTRMTGSIWNGAYLTNSLDGGSGYDPPRLPGRWRMMGWSGHFGTHGAALCQRVE